MRRVFAILPRVIQPASLTVSLVGMLCASASAKPGLAPATPEDPSALFTCPPLPSEGEEVAITLRISRTAKGESGEQVHFQILDSHGKTMFEQDARLTAKGQKSEATVRWRPAKNGLYQVMASSGKEQVGALSVPVIIKGRPVDFVWWVHHPWMRWATVITTTTEDQLLMFRERGIRALRWQWGSNHPMLNEEGKMPQQFAAEAEKFYKVPEGFTFDGYGLDEFGDYPQSPKEERSEMWLRGLLKARRQFPKGFIVAAWHAGGVRDEWVGLYKQAADFLLIEAYAMQYVPHDLGTENIYEFLRGKLISLREADMFTRAYGFPCEALLALDIAGKKNTYGDVGELEQIVRFIRREFPEMRGLAFFNGSDAIESVERAAHQMCFDYYVRPVVTFQDRSLWLDRFGKHMQIVGAVSNIGGMDSGPVVVRIRVNGKVIETQRLASVPAGDSRLTNRAFVRADLHPKKPGMYDLEAEIIFAEGSTVLDGRASERRFVDPGLSSTPTSPE